MYAHQFPEVEGGTEGNALARPQSFHRLDFMHHNSNKAVSISEATEVALRLKVVSGGTWQVPSL